MIHKFSPIQKTTSEAKSEGDYVVILHGIARSSNHMKKLASYLENNGFNVINLSYPSTTYKIEQLTEIINREIATKVKKDKKLYFVGYSMGGLIVRALIHKYGYKNLGRVVQLAPPNHGSEVADFVRACLQTNCLGSRAILPEFRARISEEYATIPKKFSEGSRAKEPRSEAIKASESFSLETGSKDFWLYKKIYGPAGQQLVTNQDAIKHLFGEVSYELGIIAGNASIDPISSAIIPGANDDKVAVERTKLEGMNDHAVIFASHTFFPSNKKVQKQTLSFLQHDKFQH